MFAIGLALVAVAGWIGVWELRAVRKRLRIRKLRKVTTTPLSFGHRMDWDSVAMNAGAAGWTLLDVYDQMSNHYDVLQELQQRYPQEMGDASYADWMNKIESLFHDGQSAVDNYVNAYVGRMAEDLAAAHLQAQGLQVEHFASQTHPDNDLRVHHPDGSFTDYSVKSYASTAEFHQAVAEHADSHHYIVNHELYQQLAHQGELQSYAQQGIEILDGGYSNGDLHEHAQNALSHIHHAVDSGGTHIPVIGLLFYGLKSAENVRQFFNREQTGNELAANLIGDGVGLGARTGAGFLGGYMGASIGTMIAPGIGTVIGAGIAGLIASLSAGSFVAMLKERWKYGDILEAQGLIGERYLKQFPPEALEQLQERVYRVPEVERALRMELPLLDDYRNQLDPYKAERPTLAAVLCSEYVRHLEARCRQAKRAARAAEKKIVQVCRRAAEHVKQDTDQATKQFLGELVLGGDILLTRKVEREFAEYIVRYRQRVAKYPHHPYRFKYPARDVVHALAIQALEETAEPLPPVPLVGRLPMSLIIITGTIGIWMTVIRPH